MPLVFYFFTFSFILAFHYISFYFFPAKRKYFGQRIFYILLFIFFPSLPFPFPSLSFLGSSFLFFCFCVSCFVFIQKMLGYRSVFFSPCIFRPKKNDDTMRSRPRMAAAEKADQDFPPGAESYVMIEQLLLRGCKTTPMEINSLSVLAQGSSCE